VLAATAALALAGCLGNSGGPTAPPSAVRAYPGDTAISVTWQDLSNVTYWLFYAQDPRVTPFDLDNNNSPLLNFGYQAPRTSPVILCNSFSTTVINQSLAANGGYPPYYFTINGRTGTSKGGAGSAPVAAMPRPAASSGVPWVPGDTIPAAINSLGYIGLTSCGYSGMPPSGMYIAVGPGATVYTSTLAPFVAGPLTNPGNVHMSWARADIPLGFGANLNAVAGRVTYGNNPTNPGLLAAAVGDGASIIRSLDGLHWQLANPLPASGTPQSDNLHDVAVASSGFVAVGDSGLVVTSQDALNWTVNTSAEQVNVNHSALRAVRCAGNTCIAVGDAGAILSSTTSGAFWSALNFGQNNWTLVAFGNNDANSDAVYVNGTYNIGMESINTWVVADAQGNYVYFNPSTSGTWIRGAQPIAPGLVALDYTSSFVALDSAGNAWINERASSGSWATYTSATLAVNGGQAVAMRSNGLGYVAVGSTGANAASF
jgi:hypothetical protein